MKNRVAVEADLKNARMVSDVSKHEATHVSVSVDPSAQRDLFSNIKLCNMTAVSSPAGPRETLAMIC